MSYKGTKRDQCHAAKDLTPVQLDHWCIVEYGDEHSQILLGFVEGKKGIVSGLVHFDAVTRLVLTRSGIKYELVGDHDINDRARKHLISYMNERGIEDLLDVSDSIVNAMNGAKQ